MFSFEGWSWKFVNLSAKLVEIATNRMKGDYLSCPESKLQSTFSGNGEAATFIATKKRVSFSSSPGSIMTYPSPSPCMKRHTGMLFG